MSSPRRLDSVIIYHSRYFYSVSKRHCHRTSLDLSSTTEESPRKTRSNNTHTHRYWSRHSTGRPRVISSFPAGIAEHLPQVNSSISRLPLDGSLSNSREVFGPCCRRPAVASSPFNPVSILLFFFPTSHRPWDFLKRQPLPSLRLPALSIFVVHLLNHIHRPATSFGIKHHSLLRILGLVSPRSFFFVLEIHHDVG